MAHCSSCGAFYLGTPITWTTCEECELGEELSRLECWQDCGEFTCDEDEARMAVIKERLAALKQLADEDEIIARQHP